MCRDITTLLKLCGKYPQNSYYTFLGELLCLDTFITKHRSELKAGVLGLLVLISITACKARASNPALNFAPVPDAAPQNSYADIVSKAAPAVITICVYNRCRTPQQFTFLDDTFFRCLYSNCLL